MTGKTKIEWTGYTWNPVRGCSRVSEGCKNCYAEKIAKRFSGPGLAYEGLIAKGGQWNGEIRLLHDKLDEPLSWNRPRMIFVNSMTDIFHESVPFEFINEVFKVMALAKQHTFQVLTKRPERMEQYFRWLNWEGVFHDFGDFFKNLEWPLPNVWLGVSVENQETAIERIPLLLETPAAIRFLSMEPLIGLVDFYEVSNSWYKNKYQPWRNVPILTDIDWVIVGGESGPGARHMEPGWAHLIMDQCHSSNTPFFMKQMSKKEPIPDELLVRQFPYGKEDLFGK